MMTVSRLAVIQAVINTIECLDVLIDLLLEQQLCMDSDSHIAYSAYKSHKINSVVRLSSAAIVADSAEVTV